MRTNWQTQPSLFAKMTTRRLHQLNSSSSSPTGHKFSLHTTKITRSHIIDYLGQNRRAENKKILKVCNDIFHMQTVNIEQKSEGPSCRLKWTVLNDVRIPYSADSSHEWRETTTHRVHMSWMTWNKHTLTQQSAETENYCKTAVWVFNDVHLSWDGLSSVEWCKTTLL